MIIPFLYGLFQAKKFEGLLYDCMSKFFMENSLMSKNQSGFKPDEFWTNQLLSIKHHICRSVDDGQKLWSVFLDMSKAFDKIWLKCLIFNSKSNSTSVNFLRTLFHWLLEI